MLVVLLGGFWRFESVGLRSGLYWVGGLLQEGVQVTSFEQSVSIGWVSVHRDLATRCPFADVVLGHAQVLRCCGCVQVFGQFVHWIRPPSSYRPSDASASEKASLANPAR